MSTAADGTQLTAAIEAARQSPEVMARWDEVERVAASLDRPEDALQTYSDLLQTDLPDKLVPALGRRAAAFHDEWLGEPTPQLVGVLERVLSVDGKADWAFQRLTVALTVGEKWDQLLSLYDRALESETSKSRRGSLLEEAANVAKDFASDQDRAIGYLQQLRELRPRNKPVALALERLLDKNERWTDLIELWTARLAVLKGEAAMQTRERIATCWLEQLNRPDEALQAVDALLRETQDDTEALRLLEGIARNPATPAQTRDGALDLLRARYVELNRERDLVGVLEAAMEHVSPEQRKDLRAEAGKLLATLGEGSKSFDHFATLLVQEPGNLAAEQELRHLAHQADEFARLSTVLADAGRKAEQPARRLYLLRAAADVCLDPLGDRDAAIDLLSEAYRVDGPAADVADVCRDLDGLLEAAERDADRLDVLERLANLEDRPDERRRVLGELARMAERIGESKRAASTWKQRLSDDAGDLVAITALIEQHAANDNAAALVSSLRRRVEAEVPEHQRRADLERMATLLRDDLSDPTSAVDIWIEIHGRFGSSAASVEVLASLLSGTERWQEYADLLDNSATADLIRSVDWLARCGDACRERLDTPARAVGIYRRGLDVDPRHEGCRAGLHALLDTDQRSACLDALASACERTDEWQQALELVAPRLSAAAGDAARVAILKDAARVHEQRGQDLAEAFSAIRRAVVYAPGDDHLVAELERLGTAADALDGVCETLAQAAGITDDAGLAARLRRREGELHEHQRGDRAAALDAYKAARAARPDDIALLDAIARTAVGINAWTDATSAAVAAIERDGLGDGQRVDTISAAADDLDVAAVADALAEAIGGATGLTAADAARLESRVAALYRDRAGDYPAAEAALRRSLASVANDAGVLSQLVALLRRSPDASLYDALRRLAAVNSDDLDALVESAEVAAGPMADAAVERDALESTLARSVRMWRTGAIPIGVRQPDATANASLDRLVELYGQSGDHALAIAALEEAIRWPVDAQRRRQLRFRAGELAVSAQDSLRAVGFYRAAFADDASDVDALAHMATLYDALDDVGELLAVRRAQLERATDAGERVELRLDLSRLVGVLVERSGRLDGLRKNLVERPGHRASLDALCELLRERASFREMADVLSEQAAAVQDGDDPAYASSVWLRAAQVCEVELADVDRALAAYERSVALAPACAPALDGLARLHVDRGAHARAVPWLQQWLGYATADGSADSGAADITLRLAEALIASGDTERAIQRLESADARVSDPRLRELLGQLYRDAEAWEPLGRLLTESLGVLGDDADIIATAREVATIYDERMGEPQRAVAALERAIQVSPDDVALRTQLAFGLRLAGRLDDARSLLETMIESFGRRRSSERAAVHHELALVARDQGDVDTALEQLDLAAKMDVGNGEVLRSLAELARKHDRFEEAERAYRALLLVARRRSTDDDASLIGPSEVLFELHYLAADTDDEERAAELRESALETAIESDLEVSRARRVLVARGDYATLLEVLEERLEMITDGEARAQALAFLAEALEKVGRGDESLDVLLRALESAPGREDLHDAARDAAAAAGSVDRYIDAVQLLSTKARRKEDAARAAVLYWKLGLALERDRGDIDGAADAYLRMERTGARQADALSAQARVHGVRGDSAAQARALSELLRMADDAGPEVRADALYQLAEVRIVDPETHADGLGHLQEAMSADARYGRAGAILRAALESMPGSTDALVLYHSVARRANDRELVLDCVERRVSAGVATPDEVRDGVETARAIDAMDRAEALLNAAIRQVREAEGGLAAHTWAPMALAHFRQRDGDYDAAVDLVLESPAVGAVDAVWDDAIALAAAAREAGSDDVAVRAYASLREYRPTDRQAWGPLFDMHVESGEHDQLETLAGELLPALMDVDERNGLRILFADVLRKAPARHGAAMELYKDILLEQPGNIEAATHYEQLLEESGTDDDIIAFLTVRYDEARDSKEPERVAAAALRLGARLAQASPGEAVDVYRQAAEFAPDDAALLTAIVDSIDGEDDPGERAAWTERLLARLEGDAAAERALELFAVRVALDDDVAAGRALEMGYAAAPERADVRDRLEQWYRDGGHLRPLAGMLVTEGKRRADAAVSVPMLLEAAATYRDLLFEIGSAVLALRDAVEIAPQNVDVLTELVRTLESQGDAAATVEVTRGALERGIDDDEDRVTVLLMAARSELGVGNVAAATEALEQAHGIAPARAGDMLAQVLVTAQANARDGGDFDAERSATLRIAQLQLQSGQEEECRETLVQWLSRSPDDRDVLAQICELDAAIEHWDGVIAVCERLVYLEVEDAQVRWALRLADAAARGGNPDNARRGLEAAYAAQPDEPDVRGALERVYVAAGAYAQLAVMAMRDAEAASDDGARFAAFMRAAELYVNAQDGDAALAALDGARVLRPEDSELALRYVDALVAAGRLQEAQQVLEPLIDTQRPRSPDQAPLQLRRARIARAAGDGETEVSSLELVFDIDRDNGAIAAELARAAETHGNIPLAIKALRTISLKKLDGPMEPHEAIVAEARLELIRGNPGKARMLVRKVVRERPDYGPAIEIMEQANAK